VPPVEQLKLPPQPAPPPEPQPAAEPVPLDPRLLKGFQNALAENARRYKRYPRRAMDEGWQGTVLVKLHVGASGRVQELLIDRSSGHEILDREAVEMVRKGAPLAALPPELRGRAVIVLVPVVFRLE
jgi:protein TonB